LSTPNAGYKMSRVNWLLSFAAAFPVAQTLFWSLGYILADYTGPQWPFPYSYGSPATKRNVTRLLNVLREA
jgi:hypothetical protein